MPFTPRLTEEELRLFLDRISRSLAERRLDLPVDEHRERVAALVREMGETTYYQFLGIEPSATALEVHEAFERTARMVHPDNARRLGLEGREGVLQVLFERATEAYLTLSAIDQRKQYDREMGPRIWQKPSAPVVSQADEAARLYQKARALVVAEQIHPAVELLREAVRRAPKAEYLVLLGTLEAKNPHWLESAEHHLERAMELGARGPGLAEALQRVRENIARVAAGKPLEADEEDAGEVQVV